jgi:predicted small metal-binding protein
MMTKVLKCNDVNPGCSFEARGDSEADVLKQAAEHAKTAHKMREIPADVLSKVRGAIREEVEAASPELEAKIRVRAYELYEQRGRQDGHDLEDWFQAEAELAPQKQLHAAA